MHSTHTCYTWIFEQILASRLLALTDAEPCCSWLSSWLCSSPPLSFKYLPHPAHFNEYNITNINSSSHKCHILPSGSKILLVTKNWNEKENNGFYWLVRKEQKIGEETLLQGFPLLKWFFLSQRTNARSTSDKISLSPILPLFISNKLLYLTN